jgi:hypothetical protein
MSFVIEGQTQMGRVFYGVPETEEENQVFGYTIYNFNLDSKCVQNCDNKGLTNIIVLNSPSAVIAKKCIDAFVRYSLVNGRFVPKQYDENRPLDGRISIGCKLIS